MKISKDRLLHCREVAGKLKAMAQICPEKCGCSPQEAFLLGYVHDIGYEFADEQGEHARGAEKLARHLLELMRSGEIPVR